MFVCLFIWIDDLILGFCYDLTLKTGEFELASTITFVLQASRFTKGANHPNSFSLKEEIFTKFTSLMLSIFLSNIDLNFYFPLVKVSYVTPVSLH